MSAGTSGLGVPSGASRKTGGEHPESTLSGVYPLYVIAFIVQFGIGIVSPILPDLVRDFSLAAWQAGMIVTMFALARLIADVPLGFVLDRVNRTVVLLFGTGLIMLGSLACALVQDYGLLLAARFVMGTGSALCTVTALFSLSRATGEGSRGRAIGAYQAAMIGGNTFGPALGGFAAAIAGWRGSFLFCAFTGLLSFLLVLIASRQGALRFAPSSREKAGDTSSEATTGVRWDVIAINFTTFVFLFSMQGFRASVVPVFGGTQLGIGAGMLGLFLGIGAAVRFVITLVSGYLSDRYGRKAILVPGTCLLATGTLSFLLVSDPVGFVISLSVLCLGGFGNSVPTTMLVDVVGPRRMGMAISINRFLGDMGMLVGPVLLGFVMDAAGFHASAIVTAVLVLSTIPGIMLGVHEKRTRAPATT